jgi:tRNA dimethylallyltransferase
MASSPSPSPLAAAAAGLDLASNTGRAPAPAPLSAAPRPRVVIVVGPTGTGKSRLAVDLAAAVGGEVVNADSIQMYAGLDIASAKVTEAEKGGIPHHLFSFLRPRQVFTVRAYAALARRAIADIVARGKVPVVVGGTAYYVQSLIREGGILDEREEAGPASTAASAAAESASAAAESASSCTPHERLSRVDPVMARRLHPNDIRKVLRALEVFDNTGVPYSTVLERQAARIGGRSGPYRCKVVWLQVEDRAVHNARLDRRVQTMLDRGLLDELRALRAYLEGGREGEMEEEGGEGESSSSAAAAAATSSSSSSPAAASLWTPPSTALTSDRPSELTVRVVKEHVAETGSTFLAPRGDGADGAAVSGEEEGEDGAGRPAGTTFAHAAAAQSSMLPVNLRRRTSAASATTDPTSSATREGDYAGLLAAIGYKEFRDYLRLADDDGMATAVEGRDASSSSSAGAPAPSASSAAIPKPPSKKARLDPVAAALDDAVARLREVTHQYARKQDRFIRNRFAKRGVPMTALDTSAVGKEASPSLAPPSSSDDPDGWNRLVANQAIAETRAWLAAADSENEEEEDDEVGDGHKGPVGLVPSAPDSGRIAAWRQYTCDACGGRLLNGEDAWTNHLRSKGHKKATSRAARAAQGATWHAPRPAAGKDDGRARGEEERNPLG